MKPNKLIMEKASNKMSASLHRKLSARHDFGPSFRFSKFFITGASSGLGQALATEAASPGITLGLVARRNNRLLEISEPLREKGATIYLYPGDVRERAFLKEAAGDFETRAGTPDCIIANAGIRGALENKPDSLQDVEIMDTNYHGVRNTILPFVPGLKHAGRGTILVISSLASFLPLPGAGGYCASKSAINTWCGSLRYELKPFGIRLTIINPGFIRTEMTRDNPYPMPFVMEAEEAARLILRKAPGRRAVVSFPTPLAWGLGFLSILPPALRESILTAVLKRNR